MNAGRIACFLLLGLGGCMSCAEPAHPPDDSAASAAEEPEPEDTSVIDPKRCADDRTWVQVSAGDIQTCGLHGDGCIECWGGDEEDGELNVADSGRVDWVDYGDDDPPNGTYTHIAVSQYVSGSGHACALDPEGRVSCWGGDDVGQASPPQGTFVALSVNYGQSCGIRTDTSLACWGTWGEVDHLPTEPGFTMIATGPVGNGCAVNARGYVSCWQYEERHPDQVGNFNAVGLDYYVCGSSLDAPLYCWNASDGERFESDAVPTGAGFAYVCQSSYSGRYGCVLAEDGHVECWGGESHVPPETLFSQISCGSQHTCGVTLDGGIECWGSCDDGECDVPR